MLPEGITDWYLILQHLSFGLDQNKFDWNVEL